jgi:hypothetical protein
MHERQQSASFYARDAASSAPLLHMLAADEPPEDGFGLILGSENWIWEWTRDVPPIDVRLAVGFVLASRKSAVPPDSAPELPLSKPMFKGY